MHFGRLSCFAVPADATDSRTDPACICNQSSGDATTHASIEVATTRTSLIPSIFHYKDESSSRYAVHDRYGKMGKARKETERWLEQTSNPCVFFSSFYERVPTGRASQWVIFGLLLLLLLLLPGKFSSQKNLEVIEACQHR